jgi:hypothetical protein
MTNHTPDYRSGTWLEASVRHARDYKPSRELAKELVEAGPAAVNDALNTIFASLPNRALREVADAASRWVTDLKQVEEGGEALVDGLKTMKIATQVICDYAAQSRLARMTDFGSTSLTFRRQ